MRSHNRPQQVLALEGHFVDDVAVGSEHTLVLTSDGQVWAWGSNGEGQLGLGHTTAVLEPQCVTALANKPIKQVKPFFHNIRNIISALCHFLRRSVKLPCYE